MRKGAAPHIARRGISLLLVLALTLGLSPLPVPAALAEEVAVPPMPQGEGTIRVQVLKEDLAAPGTLMPAAGLAVERHLSYDWEGPPAQATTDDNGWATFEHVESGLTCVYLPYAWPQDSLDIYNTHVWDEQARYLQMTHDSTALNLRFELRLQTEQSRKTGAIRLQKAYYPFFTTTRFYDELSLHGQNHSSFPIDDTQLQVSGEQVTGKQFVVGRPTEDPEDPMGEVFLYWNGKDAFVADFAGAKIYITDENGQVVIEGLPEGWYDIREVNVSPGIRSILDFQMTDIYVQAGIVTYPQEMCYNAPDQYLAMLNKVDSENHMQLTGGAFVVFKLVAGEKHYLYYQTGLTAGLPVIPAYTSDLQQAHHFTAGYLSTLTEVAWYGLSADIYAANNILVPGLDAGITYHVQELQAPAGYLRSEEVLQITEEDAHELFDADVLSEDGQITYGALTLLNQRDPKSLHVFKVGGSEKTWGSRLQRLGGAEFVLMQSYHQTDGEQVTADTPAADVQYRFLTGGGTQGAAPRWSAPMAGTKVQEALAGATGEDAAAIYRDLAAGHVFVTDDAAGKAIFYLEEQQQAFVTYTPIEVKAPAGYLLSETLTQKQVEKGAALPAFVMENQPMPGSIFVVKTDWSGQVPLQGVAFALRKVYAGQPQWKDYLTYDALGEPTFDNTLADAHRFVTDAQGKIHIHGLPDGSYTFVETKAPDGYIKAGIVDDWDFANVVGLTPQTPAAYRHFRNKSVYTQPVTLMTRKHLNGQQLQAGAFTFELLAPSGEVIATTQNDAEGVVRFEGFRPPVLFDDNGRLLTSFELTLRERIADGRPGIKHDVREIKVPFSYHVPITMADDLAYMLPPRPMLRQDRPTIGQGVYAILAMILGSLVLDKELVDGFTNELALTDVTITKKWANMAGQQPRAISLQLYQDGAAYGDPIELDGVADAAPQADGSGELTAWTYTWKNLPELIQRPNPDVGADERALSHTYAYTVKELTVPENFSSAWSADGQTLTNTYVAPPTPAPTPTSKPADPTPAPTPTLKPADPTAPPTPDYPVLEVPLTARKALKNGALKPGEFTFVLKDAKGSVLAEVGNLADGTVVFPSRTFSRTVKNYQYTITERAGTDAKTTYDTTVYTVKITTTPKNGVLEAAVDVLKDGTPYAGDLVFTNVRQAPPTGDTAWQGMLLLIALAGLLGGAALVLGRRRRAER